MLATLWSSQGHRKKLSEVYLDLEEETSKLEMEINEKKTKYMVTSTYERRRNPGDLNIRSSPELPIPGKYHW